MYEGRTVVLGYAITTNAASVLVVFESVESPDNSNAHRIDIPLSSYRLLCSTSGSKPCTYCIRLSGY